MSSSHGHYLAVVCIQRAQRAYYVNCLGCSLTFRFQVRVRRNVSYLITEGWQAGGVETPDEFNLFLEYALSPLVTSWKYRGFGFSFDEMPMVHHLIWCDNIYIIAKDEHQFAIMTQELTETIYKHRLAWKPSSLECLRGGTCASQDFDFKIKMIGGHEMSFKLVDEMEVLGNRLDLTKAPQSEA